MPYEDEIPPYVEPDPELEALAHSVIGAAIEVHRQLGPGLDEATYEAALCVEFRLRGIPFARKVRVMIHYKGEEIGWKELDFLVGGRLIVEIKSIGDLGPLQKAQLNTYLKLKGEKLGLLINFNTAMLKDGIKRVIRG